MIEKPRDFFIARTNITECGKIPENIGRLSDVLRNTFLNAKNAPEKCREMFSGPQSSRDWETHANFLTDSFFSWLLFVYSDSMK